MTLTYQGMKPALLMAAMAIGALFYCVEARAAQLQTAVVAGGCFWCVEKDFESVPGVVEAVDTSSISFEVAGNTREVNVNVGDRIEQGQVLFAGSAAPRRARSKKSSRLRRLSAPSPASRAKASAWISRPAISSC